MLKEHILQQKLNKYLLSTYYVSSNWVAPRFGKMNSKRFNFGQNPIIISQVYFKIYSFLKILFHRYSMYIWWAKMTLSETFCTSTSGALHVYIYGLICNVFIGFYKYQSCWKYREASFQRLDYSSVWRYLRQWLINTC